MGQMIITALTSAGFVALITAVIQAVVGRKKMSADAAQIIEQAAGSAVERSQKEIEALTERLEKAEGTIATMGKQMSEMKDQMREKDQRVDDLEDQVEDLTDDLDAVVEYAIELRAKLREIDPTLELPPPPRRVAKHFTPQERKAKTEGDDRVT